MILKGEHPWQNFLHARKLAIEWLIREGYSLSAIAQTLSMDTVQVRLIHETPVEE